MAMSQSLRAPLIIVLLCYKQRPINTSLENFSKVVILSYFTNNDFAESWGSAKARATKTQAQATNC